MNVGHQKLQLVIPGPRCARNPESVSAPEKTDSGFCRDKAAAAPE
ncbi:MAG: hypothetical protein OJF55_001205 [Rhodanobacteraceae bacterium]|jgi:hypothetical protein|nr:MAG: hypothetical protein OJF55_001205 [Rhodanobacteraceae bacterium]